MKKLKKGCENMAKQTHTVNTEDLLKKVSELYELYKRMNQQLLSHQNLNASAVNLIDIIGDQKQTLKQVTELTGLDKSTVSRQINALVVKGLVIKEAGQDKRYSYFKLSEEAANIYSEYQLNFKKSFDLSLAGWTEEEKQMLSVLLGRLNRSLGSGLK